MKIYYWFLYLIIKKYDKELAGFWICCPQKFCTKEIFKYCKYLKSGGKI